MKIAICWLRRDLRLQDNAALYHALRSRMRVLPVFIFDADILGRLEDPADARVTFIHDTVTQLHAALQQHGSTLEVWHGSPLEVWEQILARHDVGAVYTNRDYEPGAIARDQAVARLLGTHGIGLHTSKDHVIFEGPEVLTDAGRPYSVYTPYSRKWLERLRAGRDGDPTFYFKPYPTEKYFGRLAQAAPAPVPTLEALGFVRHALPIPAAVVSDALLRRYHDTRDFPAVAGTSRLSVHLRFGTVSIRAAVAQALRLNDKFLGELIWRDFYSQILQHFRHVTEGPFKSQYAHIQWRNNEAEFAAWCAGKTGYPLVDAGMRELNTTGHMHNRVRMVVASFLTKHLLIDWRWGEAYFAQKLLDFDLASNNGGWQWAAGCGNDAAPYFRVFNPTSQQEKFDPKLEYIRKWVPELGTAAYPKPIVDHAMARVRCLEAYKIALGNAAPTE